MIGMWVRFKKLNTENTLHTYEFWTDLNDKGKFQIDEKSNQFSLIEQNDEFTENQKSELEHLVFRLIVKNNFPETKMIAYG